MVIKRTRKWQLTLLMSGVFEAAKTYSDAHLNMFVKHLREHNYLTDRQALEALETFDESLERPID